MVNVFSNEKLIAKLLDSQPDSVVWFSPVFNENNLSEVEDFEAQYCNSAAANILGLAPADVIGARLTSSALMDEESRKRIYEQCLKVWQSGEPLESTYYSPAFDRYFNVQRSKVLEGILSVTRDRTKEVKAELEQQEQEKKYQQILDTAADGIMLLDAVRNAKDEIEDFKITHCNKKGYETGKMPADSIGKTLLQVFPHLKDSEQFQLHKHVVETGEPKRFETTFRSLDGKEFGWFIVSLTRLKDGVVTNFIDVTERRQNEQQIKEQKDLVTSILDASINGLFAMDAVRDENGKIVDFTFIKINQKFADVVRRKEEDIIGKSYLSILSPSKQNGLFDLKCKVVETGETINLEYYYKHNSIDGWYNISMARLGENGVVETFTDITESKNDKEQLKKAADRLLTVINSSKAGIFTLIPEYNEAREIIDFRFGVVNEAVGAYVGQSADTLTGSLASIYFPAYTTNGLFELYKHTYVTGEIQNFDFHYKDGYNKYFNIQVVKMGEEVLVTFTDHTDIKQLQNELEVKLEELERSNASLEEFAYAASHDLQEPLRKIDIFSHRIKNEIASSLTPDTQRMFERMEGSVNRMRILINDLLTYSQVQINPEAIKTLQLQDVVEQVVQDLEEMVNETGTVVNVGKLPKIQGDERQLRQMFQNLISNSIKYRKTNEAPLINITCDNVTETDAVFNSIPDKKPGKYYLIEVQDNGIGFEQEYSEKIFLVFQRLHGRAEYEGTGVGLAIVQKVVKNHKGYILAKSKPGEGSTFQVLIPY